MTFHSLPVRALIPGLVRAVTFPFVLYWAFGFVLSLNTQMEVDPVLLFFAEWGQKVLPSLAVLFMIVALLRYWHRGYAIRSHDVLYKWGVIRRWRTILPIARIQHLETHRSAIQRPLGLATLLLYTAGGSSADMAIPGLELETAYSLRDLILSRIHGENESEQGSAPSDDEGESDE